jgi:hypothetical protein
MYSFFYILEAVTGFDSPGSLTPGFFAAVAVEI